MTRNILGVGLSRLLSRGSRLVTRVFLKKMGTQGIVQILCANGRKMVALKATLTMHIHWIFHQLGITGLSLNLMCANMKCLVISILEIKWCNFYLL